MTDQRHDERPLETADLQARADDRAYDHADDRHDDRHDEQSDGRMRTEDTRDEAQFADAPYDGTPYQDNAYDSAQAGGTDRYDERVDATRDAQQAPMGHDTRSFAQDSAMDSSVDSSADSSMRHDSMQDDSMRQHDSQHQFSSDAVGAAHTTDAGMDDTTQLFTGEEVDRFRTEWRGLQSDFVDSPRDAVQHADQLVAQVIQSLTTTFADQKRSLEGQWGEGEQVETEELRVALRQYRAFFDKLLTV